MVDTLYAIGFSLATILSLAITWRAVQIQTRKGARWLSVSMLGVMWWSFMKFIEVLVFDLGNLHLLFNALHWIGVGMVSIGVLGIGLSLSGRKEKLTYTRITVLSIFSGLPVVVWLLDPRVVGLFIPRTNVSSHLLWLIRVVDDSWVWFRWVILIYLWSIVLIGTIFLLETALERPKQDLRRILILVMIAAPLSVNILYEVDVITGATFDPTVFGFVITGLAGLAAIDRVRLFDIPFARSQIIEQFSTGVLVYGPEYQLYDYNEQAGQVLGVEPNDIGRDIRDILARTGVSSPESILKMENIAERLDGAQISISQNDRTRHFLIPVSPLDSGLSEESGHAIQLSDITERKQAEFQLRQEIELNNIIWDLLIYASSKQEIAQEFCNNLIDREQCDLIYFLVDDSDQGETLNPSILASAGRDTPYVQKILTNDSDPLGNELSIPTLNSDELIEAENTNKLNDDWQAIAKEYGIHSTIGCPVEYNNVRYGSLVACWFEDSETQINKELLDKLSRVIGYALAIRNLRDALISDTSRYARIEIVDNQAAISALAAREPFKTGRTCIRMLMKDDHSVHFYGQTSADTDDVSSLFEEWDRVNTYEAHVAANSNTRFHVELTKPSISDILDEQLSTFDSANLRDGRAYVKVQIPSQVTVGQIVKHFDEQFATVQLLASGTETPDSPSRSDLLAGLTDRQLESIKTAYTMGYFEQPKKSNAKEVATELGVGRSTVTQHLRAAERKILQTIFDSDTDVP